MNLLDQIDPLPPFENNFNNNGYWHTGAWIFNPLSKRQLEEHRRQGEAFDGEDWRPAENPAFEINGKGQLRTKDYKPPEPPETDIPIPCVFEPDAAQPASQKGKSLLDLFAKWRKEDEEKERNLQEPWSWTDEQLAAYTADGWYPHKPGDPMPCEPNHLVSLKYRDGVVTEAVASDTEDWIAYPTKVAMEVIAWKPA